MLAAAEKLKASGQECVYTTSWPSWMHIENFSAWHNVPIGTKQNGMGGLDTQFTINSPLHVRHIAMLGDMAKKGLFTYAGRTNQGDAKFSSGECAMFSGSAGAQAGIKKAAKFDWSINFIPYHDDVAGAPQNSIIGGASVWVMGGKKPDEYKGVAKFMAFLSQPEIQMEWHTSHRLRADHAGVLRADAQVRLLRQEPRRRHAGEAAHQQGADRELQGPALRQLRAGAHGDRGGTRSRVRGQEGRARPRSTTRCKRGNEILRQFEAANK